MTDIRFGTDGWRALIAEEFTFENVARCAQGLCAYLKETGAAGRGLVVGYDTRFLSPEFAETVAAVCSGLDDRHGGRDVAPLHYIVRMAVHVREVGNRGAVSEGYASAVIQ